MITEHQAKYIAHELSRQGGAGVERVGKLFMINWKVV